MRWRALRRARRGSAGLICLQRCQVGTGDGRSGTRGRGGPKRSLGRRGAVHLRSQRAVCIHREVLWLLVNRDTRDEYNNRYTKHT